MKKNKPKIIVHDSTFHTDDVFAVATLLLLLKDNAEVIRSRDPEVTKTGDYVVDTGGVYDPDKNLFDHHQHEMKDARENGVEYASFGLVWKKFGEKLCGSKKAADIVDKHLTQSVDAYDVGFPLYQSFHKDIQPLTLVQLMEYLFISADGDKDLLYEKFMEATKIAKFFIKSTIDWSKKYEDAENKIIEAYKKSDDKRIVIFDEYITDVFISAVLSNFPEPLFYVRPYKINDNWVTKVIQNYDGQFHHRKSLPEAWAGKLNEELVDVTGVSTAQFSHKGRFIVVSGSQEDAIELAKKALKA